MPPGAQIDSGAAMIPPAALRMSDRRVTDGSVMWAFIEENCAPM